MNRTLAWRGLLSLAVAIPLTACGASTPPPTVKTNEQGCTMHLSNGPQDPFQTPPPIKEACVGPYALRVPANYFDDQMGPNFDGSFGLYLEYPQLQAFAPGERINLKLDVSLRTVNIGYSYLDRVSLPEFLRRQYTPGFGKSGPAERLEDRVQGEPVHGLTPYYADLPKIYAYLRARGLREGNNLLEPGGHQDWYVQRDASGDISTVIKCTSREVVGDGVEYRDGVLGARRSDPYSDCYHVFVIPELKIAVDIRYVRFALPDWKRIEDRAREALRDFMVDGTAPSAGAGR